MDIYMIRNSRRFVNAKRDDLRIFYECDSAETTWGPILPLAGDMPVGVSRGYRDFSDASVGTEELGHLEMIGAIVHQLTRNLTDSQIEDSAFAPYFVDHTTGIYPTAAAGFPWNAASMGVKGDPMADLTENLAAEQKARVTYDNILRISDDPDVNDAILFLREREIVHFQRFGEAIELLRQKLNSHNVYSMNPAIDL